MKMIGAVSLVVVCYGVASEHNPFLDARCLEGRVVKVEEFCNSLFNYQTTAFALASIGVLQQQLLQISNDQLTKRYKKMRQRVKRQQSKIEQLEQKNADLEVQLKDQYRELTQFYQEYQNDRFEQQLVSAQEGIRGHYGSQGEEQDSLSHSPLTVSSTKSSYELLGSQASSQSPVESHVQVDAFIPENTDDEEFE